MKTGRRKALVCLVVLIAGVVCSLAISAGEAPKRVRVIYTDDTLGYLEPCGCGGKHDGGLARRATVIGDLVKESPDNVIVESGNLSNMPERLDFVVSVLSDLGYDAVGIGETDLRIPGNEFLRTAAEHKLPVVDSLGASGESTVPYIIRNVDGAKVGIVSFGATPKSDEGSDDYARRKAMFIAYKTAREGSDVLVVLDQANLVDRGWLERNGPRFGAPDIVVAGATRAYMAEEVIGRTHIVTTSPQGKHVGVVDITVTRGQEPVVESKRVMVEGKVVEDEAIKTKIKDFMTKGASKPAQFGQQQAPEVVNGKPYYASRMCQACHAKQYDDWKASKHSGAVKTLVAQNRLIPECLKCHSEMFRQQQRMMTSSAAGVECASCHVESLPHGMERKNVTARAKVKPETCLECHNKERSPAYEQQSYMAKVSHSGTAGVATTPSAVRPPAMK